MKIVTVGTGTIVEHFIETAKQINQVEIVGSYSRDLARAEKFSNKMGIGKFYDSFSTVVEDDEVNTVYIASPNALHFMQAKYFLENNKNVIVEKPLVSESVNAKELFKIAKENNLFIFEAISNVHTPNFSLIKDYLPKLGPIRMVQANYSQYSSKYDAFKSGERPNVFNQEFSGGALGDLNIYNIQLIYHLFGKPKEVTYFPNMVREIDTSGMLVMDYGSFKANATAAKDSASQCYFQVQGEDGYIISLGATNELKNMRVKTKDEDFELDHNTEHRLYGEIVAFSTLFLNNNLEETYKKFEKSIEVVEILEESWKQIGYNYKDRK